MYVSINELLEFDIVIKSWDFLARYDNVETKYLLEIWIKPHMIPLDLKMKII